MEKHNFLRETAKQTDNQADWIAYRQARNLCTKTLKNKKNEFFEKKFESLSEKNYVKNVFKMTKNILGWSAPSLPSCFLIEGHLIRKPTDVANQLQLFFEKKINVLMSKLKKKMGEIH